MNALTKTRLLVVEVRCPLCLAHRGKPCIKQNTPIGVRELCKRPHVERYAAAREESKGGQS